LERPWPKNFSTPPTITLALLLLIPPLLEPFGLGMECLTSEITEVESAFSVTNKESIYSNSNKGLFCSPSSSTWDLVSLPLASLSIRVFLL